LYFCLTGNYPKVLRDENNLAPHRRLGKTVSGILSGDPRLPDLELFFDRGFEFRMTDRFQTCKVLLARLDSLLTGEMPEENLESRAERYSAILLGGDRRSQIDQFRRLIAHATDDLPGYVTDKNMKLGQFVVTRTGSGPPTPIPSNYDDVSQFQAIA